jgi:hypothetical protein
VDVDGKLSMKPITGHVEVRGGDNATAVSHLVFTISNLQFISNGVVNFVLYMDDKQASFIPLHIRQG